MLPKEHRLAVSDFKGLKSTRSAVSPHLQLRFGQLPPESPAKAAAVVSTKVAKSAVARNLLRRRVYAVLDAHLRGKRGFFITITARSGAAALSFAILEHELGTLLKGLKTS